VVAFSSACDPSLDVSFLSGFLFFFGEAGELSDEPESRDQFVLMFDLLFLSCCHGGDR